MDAKAIHDLKNWTSSLALIPQLVEEKFDLESPRGKKILAEAKAAADALRKFTDSLVPQSASEKR